MPDTIYATTGFGYIGIDVCESCYKPNHIFVDSNFKRVFCASCHSEYGDTFDNLPVRIPNTETHDIMNQNLYTCAVCELPGIEDDHRWGLVEAKLSDNETVVRAHSRCSRIICGECNIVHAILHNREWRRSTTYFIPYNQFTATTSIEGHDYCDLCTAKFWQENDESDYFECECCEWLTHFDNSGWFDGTRYCNSCIENNVFNCGECDELCWEGNDHYCENDEDEGESLIHSYSYRPSPYFFGEGQYHFGFELEVEARGNGRYSGAQIAQNSLGGHAYLKEDGSLSDGFEIVTHPHTLEKYHTDFNWSVLDTLKDSGYRSWNTRTCGLHVHISRTAFGDAGVTWSRSLSSSQRSQFILKRQSHELRFMKLIYDNQRQVERIAGRSNNSYATFSDKGNLVRKVKEGYQGNGRYSAINTENDDTIEVRVFKGSLRKERVLSAIEFVHAVVEYTRDVKVSSKNHALSWLKFTGYVSEKAELYPNLVTIMSESFANETPNHVDED